MSTSMTWEEICADSALRDLPHKIEQDRFGRIIMTPPPGPSHADRQAEIIGLLRDSLTGWRINGDTAVQTREGVRSPDVAALRKEHRRREGNTPAYARAPAICVEVLSPTNTDEEMEEKRRLYCEAGCEEFWTCSLDGRMSFFGPDGTVLPRSGLCPNFPTAIEFGP